MRKEYKLNELVYRETCVSNYYITDSGQVAKIQFDEDGVLKKYIAMKPFIAQNGYLRIELNQQKYNIHRLVFDAWGNEPLNPLLVIDHKDANPLNNYIGNLQQVTQKENIQNAIVHGNFGHQGNEKVEITDAVTGTKTIYNSIKEFLKAIDAPAYMIKHGGLTCLRKRRMYNRYTWRKIDER